MIPLKLISKESLEAQYKWLTEAMIQTRKMLSALSEDADFIERKFNTPKLPKGSTISYHVHMAILELEEINTPSVFKYVFERTSQSVDKNFISNLLSKKCTAGIIEDIGRVQGSKARMYRRVQPIIINADE